MRFLLRHSSTMTTTPFPTKEQILEATGHPLRIMVARYLMNHPLPFSMKSVGPLAYDTHDAAGVLLPDYAGSLERAWLLARRALRCEIDVRGEVVHCKVAWRHAGCVGEHFQDAERQVEAIAKAALLSEWMRLTVEVKPVAPVAPQSGSASAPLLGTTAPAPASQIATQRYRCARGHEYDHVHEWAMAGEVVPFCPVCFLLLVARECGPVWKVSG